MTKKQSGCFFGTLCRTIKQCDEASINFSITFYRAMHYSA